MLTKFEENEARALVYQDGVSPQIAVKMRFITQKKSLNIKDLSLLWLGRLDSNQRMSAPKADALPLGDAPTKSTKKTKQRALFINFSILLYVIFFIIASIFFKKNHNFLFFGV